MKYFQMIRCLADFVVVILLVLDTVIVSHGMDLVQGIYFYTCDVSLMSFLTFLIHYIKSLLMQFKLN